MDCGAPQYMGMGSLIWGLLGLALIVAQLSTGFFDLLFLAVAALMVATGAAIIPGFGDNIALQVVSWLVCSFGAVLVFRRRFPLLFKGKELLLGTSDHSGKSVLVVEDVSPDAEGRIRFQGTTWQAYSLGETLTAGSSAYILEQDGMKFLVTSRLTDEVAENNKLEE